MRLYPQGGYENPGYGAWGGGAAIQFTVALCLLLLAAGDLDGPYPDRERPHRIHFISAALFNTLGGLHLLGACVTTGIVLIGYLGLPLFLCPLPVITILNWGLLFTTAAFCGNILSKVQALQKLRLQHQRNPNLGPLRDTDYSEMWAEANQKTLLYVACMCVAEVAFYFAGLVYSKSSTTGTRATAWLYASLLILLSGMVIFLMTALPKYSAMGVVWFALWALLLVFVMLQQYLWYRRLAVVISVLFFLSVAYSVTVWIVAAASYAHTKKYIYMWQNMTAQDVMSLSDGQYTWLRSCILSNFGLYFTLECLSTAALCIMATFSMLYAIYSVFTKKPPGVKEKKDDSADERDQADEQAELTQQPPSVGETLDWA